MQARARANYCRFRCGNNALRCWRQSLQPYKHLLVGISIEIILSFYNFIHSFITSFFIHSLLVSVLVFCLRWNSLGDLREDAQNSLFSGSRSRTATSSSAAHSPSLGFGLFAFCSVFCRASLRHRNIACYLASSDQPGALARLLSLLGRCIACSSGGVPGISAALAQPWAVSRAPLWVPTLCARSCPSLGTPARVSARSPAALTPLLAQLHSAQTRQVQHGGPRASPGYGRAARGRQTCSS